MKKRTAISRIFIALCLVIGLGTYAAPAAASVVSQPAGALTAACSFGYSQQSETYAWVEIKDTGSALAFTQPDDALAPISDIGFAFPFFEHSYTGVFVSTNGFIVFGSPSENAYPNNYALPTEFPPNNIIAGFWDDLTVGGGHNDGAVYFQVLGTAPDRKAVFEWYRVTRLGSADWLSFEIILSENGDVVLNYETLNGVLDQATVGIEDADGVDACQLVYNAAGLVSNQGVRFAFPGSGARVKAKPVYQGQFLSGGLAYLPITVMNTGSDPDSFHFEPTILAGVNDWQIDVVDGNRVELANTPVLASAEAYPAYIRVQSGPSALLGEYIQGRVSFISNANPAKTFSVYFDAAVPAPFAAFYIDSSTAMLRYSLPQRQIAGAVFSSFSGSTLAVSQIAGQEYFLSWEYIRRGASQDYENIQRAVADPTAGVKLPVANLVDNAAQPASVFDAGPMMAVSPDGTIGLVFIRSIPNETYNLNTNVYFARLDSSGTLLDQPLNLTQSGVYYADLIYNQPVIAATPDNNFVIAFESRTALGGSLFARDIDLAVVSSAGQVLAAPYHMTDSQGSGQEFYAPAVTPMGDGNVFVAFLVWESENPLSQIETTVFHPGSLSADPFRLLGAEGEDPQVTTLTDGSILLAWVKEGSLSLGYCLFDPHGDIKSGMPLALESVNGWKVENISLAGEINGHGILSWQDEWGYHLYYALVGPAGDLVTPAMAFLRGLDPDSPNIISSSTGKGIAPLPNVIYWRAYLPATIK